MFNKKDKKNKIIILLKSVIRNINRKKNESTLRKYFNNWKKHLPNKNKNIEAAKNHLLKTINNKIGKYFLKKLKDNKKYVLLRNIISKNRRPNEELLDYNFKKWLYITKRLDQTDFANIIQKFCLNQLRNKKIENKWKRLYSLLKNKDRNNDIKDLLNILKKYVSVKKTVELLKGKNNKNIFYRKFVNIFLDKLKNVKEKIPKEKNINILKKIIIRINNKKKNKLLKNALNKWRNKVADFEIGKLKGKLLLKIYDKYNTNKIKDILKKTLKNWENNTIFIDKIKNKINKENLETMNIENKKSKVVIILKSIIRNNNRKKNDAILRKFLNKWKKNIKDIENKKNENIEYVGKQLLFITKKINGKAFFKKLMNLNREKKLKNVIKNYKKIPNNSALDYHFSKWLYINKKLQLNDKAKIIQDFCKMISSKNSCINNWQKLYSMLQDKDRKDNIKDLAKNLKNYAGFTKLAKIFKDRNRKNVFDKLKKQKNKKQITITYIEIIDTFNKKNNNKLLEKYFLKWRNNTRKKNNRDEALSKMMNLLELNRIKNSANILSNAFLINKLLKDIPKIGAVSFLRKVKKDGKYNKLYKIFSYDLIDIKEDLFKHKKKSLIDKILKIYAYKILSKLFDTLDKKQNNKNILHMRDFFDRLYQNGIRKKAYNYIKEESLEGEPTILKGMTFKNEKKPKILKDDKYNKNIIYKKLTPSFVRYLDRIFKKQNYDIFDKIKNKGNGDKFCKLLKIFSKKTIIPDKEDLVDSLKYYVYLQLTKERDTNKLYNLIRKAIIRKILNIGKSIGNTTRLDHLVKLTITHKKILNDRWLLNLIKKWRFITFVKKMAMKKMELMYKDLHVTYLEMADTILKEDHPLGPYDKLFMPDHKEDKNRFLFNFNDPLLLKGAKPYKGARRQFVFKPIDAELEKEIKYIQEIENIEKTKEINKTYYDYDYDTRKKMRNKKVTKEVFEEEKKDYGTEGIRGSNQGEGKNFSKGGYQYEYEKKKNIKGANDDEYNKYEGNYEEYDDGYEYEDNNNNIKTFGQDYYYPNTDDKKDETKYYSSSSYYKAPEYKQYKITKSVENI